MSLDKHSCMTRAKALLSAPTAENLRYAALELRLCMEAITYEKLRSVAERIPESVLRTWQPPQAVKAMLEYEPDADRSYTLSIGAEEAYGVPPKVMQVMGTHNTLPLSWLRKYYNKLGGFLHLPSPGSRQSPSPEKVAAELLQIVADLEAPLASTIGGTFGKVYTFSCARCESVVVKNAAAVQRSRKATCLNPQCGAEYFATFAPDNSVSFELMVTRFPCADKSCSGVAEVENRRLDVGVEFVCPKCKLKQTIAQRHWAYGPLEG
jgi:hypothetical protein